MKPFSFFRLFYLPFYSPDVYIDSAKNRKGFMIVTFFLFFLVCSIPFVVNLASTMGLWDKVITQQLQKMPEFTVSEGKLSLPPGIKPFLSHDKENKIAIVVDPAADEDILKPYGQGILFSGKKFYVKNGISTPSFEYSQKGISLINYSVMRSIMIFAYVIFIMFGLPILLGLIFFGHFFIAITIYFFSVFFAESREMEKEMVFRIAVTATLPMTLVICLLRAAGLETLILYLGALVVSAFFMNFGLKQVGHSGN